MFRLVLLSVLAICLVSCGAATASNGVLQRVNYSQLDPPVGPYVHAIRHGGTIYLSGLTAFGTDAQGAPLPDQIRAIYAQMNTIAEAEGIGLDHILQVTIFVTTLDDIQGLRAALEDIYQGAYPSSTLVQVAGLFHPEVIVEVQAVLAMSDD